MLFQVSGRIPVYHFWRHPNLHYDWWGPRGFSELWLSALLSHARPRFLHALLIHPCGSTDVSGRPTLIQSTADRVTVRGPPVSIKRGDGCETDDGMSPRGARDGACLPASWACSVKGLLVVVFWFSSFRRAEAERNADLSLVAEFLRSLMPLSLDTNATLEAMIGEFCNACQEGPLQGGVCAHLVDFRSVSRWQMQAPSSGWRRRSCETCRCSRMWVASA